MHHAFADYWLAWRVIFESDEKIIAVKSEGKFRTDASRRRRDEGERGRYPPFYEAVTADPNAAYVFLAGTARESASRRRLLAAGYRRLRTGDFVVYLRS